MSAAFFQDNYNDRNVSSLFGGNPESQKLSSSAGEDHAASAVRQVQQSLENFLRLDNKQEAYLKAMQSACFDFQGAICAAGESSVAIADKKGQEPRPALLR